MTDRELNEFQKAFREKEARESAQMREQEYEDIDENEEVDTQHGRYMTFKCEDNYYGIAIIYVNEIIGLQPITELPETPEYIRGLINLRGKVVPIVDVRARFGKPEIEYDDRTCVIVINVEDDTVGLIVDTIADVVSIKDEDILEPPTINHASDNKFIFGLGKVGDEVKMLIDPTKLIYD